MLKRSAVLALAVLAISLGAVAPVWAATSARPAQNAPAQPVSTVSPSSSSDGDMTGMSDNSMPGMHHATPTPTQTMVMSDDEMAGMNHAGSQTASSAHRPLGAVVGTFAAVAGSVLVAAGLMRLRDKRHTASTSKPSRSTT